MFAVPLTVVFIWKMEFRKPIILPLWRRAWRFMCVCKEEQFVSILRPRVGQFGEGEPLLSRSRAVSQPGLLDA